MLLLTHVCAYQSHLLIPTNNAFKAHPPLFGIYFIFEHTSQAKLALYYTFRLHVEVSYIICHCSFSNMLTSDYRQCVEEAEP